MLRTFGPQARSVAPTPNPVEDEALQRLWRAHEPLFRQLRELSPPEPGSAEATVQKYSRLLGRVQKLTSTSATPAA